MRREAVRLGPEVAQALAEGRPVVALESSVLAQGLPAPHNLESLHACQQAIRSAGAVPALTAFVAGEPVAGVCEQEVLQLVAPANKALKAGARDAAAALAFGRWGATTVSGTCAIANAVGIRFFATGGIGGVHREAERTFDISQDLLAIAQSRVAVVTAGAKAILDLPRTLEALEALGVPVIGYRTAEFPAFYTNHSGLPLEHHLDSPAAAARLLRARWDILGEAGGVVIANPVPLEAEADQHAIQEAIEAALRRAAEQDVHGKALTPFLLSEVRRAAGESLEANLAVLVSNARVAAELAVGFALR